MRGIRLAAWACVCLSIISSGLSAQPKGAEGPKLDETLGPFSIEGQLFTVALHRQAIPEANPDHAGTDCDHATVISMEILNGLGVIEYKRSFPYLNCDSMNVVASVLKGAAHSGLLIDYKMYYQTCCVDPPYDADNSYQLFGSIGGHLKAFNAPMTVVFLREEKKKNDPSQAEVAPLDADSDAWNLRVWANKFDVIYPVRIDWRLGKLMPLKSCSRQPRAYCEYAVDPIREFQDLKLWPFTLHLCAEPASPCGKAEDVKLAAKPRIKMLDSFARLDWNDDPNQSAKGPKDASTEVSPISDAWLLGVCDDYEKPAKVWLKLQINGNVGWLSDMEALQNIGFPYEE
jgi:hypothetical protein